ncbi:Fe-Mn family superoxide dismutase [Afifella sp. H1R]|uniref:Fe-Mn family superoxide dismutase n=1 Tax=Afifella sp. H1R TaxID=2908841 RepID=UPI001F1FEC5D|nr:Fe-Mn family superoxide dismutase [Afifella sp. H1R]MCF1505597.1 Fe-Mn family superoxide dismutase [Afifella sp. H1R]
MIDRSTATGDGTNREVALRTPGPDGATIAAVILVVSLDDSNARPKHLKAWFDSLVTWDDVAELYEAGNSTHELCPAPMASTF